MMVQHKLDDVAASEKLSGHSQDLNIKLRQMHRRMRQSIAGTVTPGGSGIHECSLPQDRVVEKTGTRTP